MHIIALYGSLAERSINKALARAAAQYAPEGMTIELMGPGELPLFSQDLEKTAFPERANEARASLNAADGVLIITPEYNRTIPGPLKNFLDWSSRPDGEPNPWNGKPVGVLGASNGMRGASFAQYDVRRIMGYFNARVMGQPEFYFGVAPDKMHENQNIADEKTIDVLRRFLAAFKSHVESTARAKEHASGAAI